MSSWPVPEPQQPSRDRHDQAARQLAAARREAEARRECERRDRRIESLPAPCHMLEWTWSLPAEEATFEIYFRRAELIQILAFRAIGANAAPIGPRQRLQLENELSAHIEQAGDTYDRLLSRLAEQHH